MRVVVTGGAGFIGSHVADAFLAAGHEVGVVDDLSTGTKENVDPRIQFWQADIRGADLGSILADFRPDAISHHAAQVSVSASTRDPRHDADINILGTLNLLEEAVRHEVGRVIFASTGGAVYGDGVVVPTDEKACPRPISPYGVAKLSIEHYLHAFQATRGLRAVVLRYSNVYGPRQNPHGEAGVVAIFSGAILEGRELTITGDGGQTRDYVYVEDVVRANLLATTLRLDGELPVLNIGTGTETSVNDLVRVFGEIAGRDFSWRHGPPRPGEQRRSALDCALAKHLLGWEARTSLPTGLARTYQWFEKKLHGGNPGSP
jgi:UDP-glucose 4-epimerase